MLNINAITENKEIWERTKKKTQDDMRKKIWQIILTTIVSSNEWKDVSTLQSELTQRKINWIKDTKTTFEDFCNKYRTLDIKNDSLLDAILDRRGYIYINNKKI